ncbi:TIGR00730 family Rossman fold protein [Marinobacter caseinilyticus]|uniref:LOG family protein n=1 Tax=Marinobacter caseinilyticus TaxID=2692195 RepID=UPI0014087829|nr:TIGR00730 family Rossman fold protein [Marinobacter caseinilyticus]
MKLAVFCGSSPGNNARYAQSAADLGAFMAGKGIDLVFGGGHVGLMGAIADAVLAGGGKVYGVIPESLLDRELGHTGLTQLQVVADMHERKAAMAAMADGFVALPGGPGTMEELFEAWTWAQLGYHDKPCALYNAFGFYDHLLAFIDKMADAGFLKADHANMLMVESSPEGLIQAMEGYKPPASKWS